MRRKRTVRRGLWAGLALVVAAPLVVILADKGDDASDEPPAPPRVLNHIAEKNDDAAIAAAVRMEARSEARTRAVEARSGADPAGD